MHIVTKILVVIAAVLSILLSALTIAFSTNAERITDGYEAIRAEKEAAETAMQAAVAEEAAERQKKAQELQALEGEIDALAEQIDSLKQRNANLITQNAQAVTDRQTVLARIDQLSATAQTQATLIENMYSELTGLRDNELQHEQQKIQFTERINDLAGQLEVALETNRALQERLVELQAQAGAGTAGVGGERRPFGQRELQARVTNVMREPSSGRLLAEIDAGTSDDLRPGVDLVIARNGEFVANLTVENATLNEAIGRVQTLGRNVNVQAGDAVYRLRR